jgi:hypothetical protein
MAKRVPAYGIARRTGMSSVLQEWPRLRRGHLLGSNHLRGCSPYFTRDRAEGEDSNGNVFWLRV